MTPLPALPLVYGKPGAASFRHTHGDLVVEYQQAWHVGMGPVARLDCPLCGELLDQVDGDDMSSGLVTIDDPSVLDALLELEVRAELEQEAAARKVADRKAEIRSKLQPAP